MLADLFQHFGEGRIEHWSAKTWEAFALQALWRICRDGVRGVRHGPPVRRRPAAPRPAARSDRAWTPTGRSTTC